MKRWLVLTWDAWRSGFWLVPSLMVVLALALAVGLLEVDRAVDIDSHPQLRWLATTGPAARATLSSLAGALITVAGVVFSTAMVVLSLTTSQFGTRLLRAFLMRQTAQWTLGVFLGASVYSLLVLKSIEVDGEYARVVPHLSTGVAVAMGVASLLLFVYFIHSVSVSVQAHTVITAVAEDLDGAIESLFPEQIGHDEPPEQVAEDKSRCESGSTDVRAIASFRRGYVQGIEGDRLMDIARAADATLVLKKRPGDFVADGETLAEIRFGVSANGSPASGFNDLAQAINGAYVLGARRTPRQDVSCALLELVEIALRALSPGINDPFTAMSCIDYLGAALRRLAGRRIPPAHRYDDEGVVRVIGEPKRFAELLDESFDQIRHYGRDNAAVLGRIAKALASIADVARRDEDRTALCRHADRLRHAATRNVVEGSGQEAVERASADVLDKFGYDRASSIEEAAAAVTPERTGA